MSIKLGGYYTRYEIVATKYGKTSNPFKDSRTFKSKRYAEKKCEDLQAGFNITNRGVILFVREIETPIVCPHCGK